MTKKILILGVNGFIGSALTEAILKQKDWLVYGMDIASDKVEDCLTNPRFQFVEGDITINQEWIEYHIKKCDIILPLVAIATPALYVSHPLDVFELDFEANLAIIRKCVLYKKRLVFPSTSEVYGMCEDTLFDEETSPLILGPINKQRWIYSCIKQLLDRVIFAYGLRDNLDYTLVRPFNWIGPKLDSIFAAKEGSSRSVTQFISDIIHRGEVRLTDGGKQRRTFTDIDDGIDGLLRILENKDGQASGRIFNLGNPQNDYSIKDLVDTIIALMKEYPETLEIAEKVKITPVDAATFYGKHYQDTQYRVPAIENARKYLGWEPKIDLETALRKTLDYHLSRPDITLSNITA